MTKTNDWKKEFEETRLVKEGGSCFECCDYEGIYDDMKNFIRHLLSSELDRAIESERKRIREEFIKLAIKGKDDRDDLKGF